MTTSEILASVDGLIAWLLAAARCSYASRVPLMASNFSSSNFSSRCSYCCISMRLERFIGATEMSDAESSSSLRCLGGSDDRRGRRTLNTSSRSGDSSRRVGSVKSRVRPILWEMGATWRSSSDCLGVCS